MTKEEAIEIVRDNYLLIQFKNTLKFIQGSTNMTLDRLNEALDLMCASILIEGMTRGVREAVDEVEQRIKEGLKPGPLGAGNPTEIDVTPGITLVGPPSSVFHPVPGPKKM